MTRDTLPNPRTSVTFTLEFQGERYDVTTGFYPDGRIGVRYFSENIVMESCDDCKVC